MNSISMYTPGASPLEELWITDLLSKSAPMTTTNSFTDALNFEMSNFEQYPVSTDFSGLLKEESIFSGSSRSSSTVSSTPPIKEEEEDEVEADNSGKTHILDGVSAKLQMMQRRNDLTPKALESIFDTKDVLKDTMDGQAGLASNTLTHSMSHPEPVLSQPKKKRCSRRRLTETQKEAHNKVEKKYRVNINSKINSLQTIIPWFSNESDLTMDTKVNKSAILEKAFDYIVYLKSENAALKSRLGQSA